MNTERILSPEKKIREISQILPMRFSKGIFRYAIFIILTLLLVQFIGNGVFAEPILYEHQIIMIHGDDPRTEETEPENQIVALERLSILVPWNESYVEVSVPLDAQPVDVDEVFNAGSMGYISGIYSADRNQDNPPYKEFISMEEMDCCYSDLYVWGFPGDADRNFSVSTHLDTELEFNQSIDEIRSDDTWNISSSGLKLEPGQVFGEYISVMTTLGVNITTVEMDWELSEHEQNVSFFISNNNGTDWINMNGNKGEEVNFSVLGKELIFKINMTQDIGQNNTPVLNGLWVNMTYTPPYNDIILQLEYIINKDSETGKFEFLLDLTKDYYDGPSLYVIIYINKNYALNSSGVPLMFFGEQEEYPDKDAYVFMSLEGTTSNGAAITVKKVEEQEGQFPWLLLIGLFLIVLAIIIFVITRREKETEEIQDVQGEEAREEKIEKLKQKKIGLLKAIKKLDKDFEDGSLDEETYNELKSSYKKKAAGVAKKMDELKMSAMSLDEGAESSTERDQLLEEKERILKSIKKLDSDFQNGLLDEEVYNELHLDYKKKAVDIMKELDKIEQR